MSTSTRGSSHVLVGANCRNEECSGGLTRWDSAAADLDLDSIVQTTTTTASTHSEYSCSSKRSYRRRVAGCYSGECVRKKGSSLSLALVVVVTSLALLGGLLLPQEPSTLFGRVVDGGDATFPSLSFLEWKAPTLIHFAAAAAAAVDSTTRASQIRCASAEAYYIADGSDYRGHVNVTASGLTCQKWSVQVPHAHDTVCPDVTAGIGDHNYCRNPSGGTAPGCYTTDPLVPYENCNVGRPCERNPLPSSSVSFSPVSGASVSYGSFVAIACFPSPCEIRYTLDGSAPSATASPLYSLPLQVTAETENAKVMIRTLTRFAGDVYVSKNSTYTVKDIPQKKPVLFRPPSTGVEYSEPVLVTLVGLTEDSTSGASGPSSTADKVLVFFDDDLTPMTYTGPFWISRTTKIIVVVNEKDVYTTTYTINDITGRNIVVVPAGGTFTGGIDMLVVQDQLSTTYAVQVRHCSNSTTNVSAVANSTCGTALSTEWTALDPAVPGSFAVQLRKVGINMVTVRATYFAGVVVYRTLTFVIYSADAPTLLPSPDTVYNFATEVTCLDPRGNVLKLYQLDSNGNEIIENVDSSEVDDAGDVLTGDESALDPEYAAFLKRKKLSLGTPGTFSVRCGYTDSLGNVHNRTANYVLEALPLLPPTASPCGRTLPASSPVYLELSLNATYVPVNKSATQYYLSAVPSSGAIQKLGWFGNGRAVEYLYSPSSDQNESVQSTQIQFVLTSSDPMQSASGAVTCNLTFAPASVSGVNDTSSTPYFRTMVSPVFQELVSQAALNATNTTQQVSTTEAMRRLLSRCLFLDTASAPGVVYVDAFGPYFLLRAVNLSSNIVPDYYRFLSRCLTRFTAPYNQTLFTYESFLLDSGADAGNNTVSTVFYPSVTLGQNGSTALPPSLSAPWSSVTSIFSETINETAGFFVATQWGNVHTDDATSPNVYTDQYVNVTVYGWLLTQAEFRLVRSEYTCDDLGVRPTAIFADVVESAEEEQQQEEEGAGSATVSLARRKREAMTMRFALNVAGGYKLCARPRNVDPYEVPAIVCETNSSSIVPATLAESCLAAPGVLNVVPRPWPSLSASPCGGRIDSSSVAASVSAQYLTTTVAVTAPPFLLASSTAPNWYPLLYYSNNTATWRNRSILSSASQITHLYGNYSGFATVSVPLRLPVSNLLNRNANTTNVSTLAVTLGSESATSQVCVVYASDAIANPSQIQYSFATQSLKSFNISTATSYPSVRVLLMLHGDFTSSLERHVVFTVSRTDSSSSNATAAAFQSVATSNATFAMADKTWAAQASLDMRPLNVSVELDGWTLASVAPQHVALSPLALGMYRCSERVAVNPSDTIAAACVQDSGWCVDNFTVVNASGAATTPTEVVRSTSCVCIGEVNKTAYTCAPSKKVTPINPNPWWERLLLFLLYLCLLAVLAAGIAFAIIRGTQRKRQAHKEHVEGRTSSRGSAAGTTRPTKAYDIVVEDCEATEKPANAPPTTAAAAQDSEKTA